MKIKADKKLLCTLLLCICSVVIMILALISVDEPEQLAFVPPAFESAAVTGSPEVPDELGWSELDAQVFKVSVCGVIIPDGDSADVWLTNPESNNVWVKLRILDTDGNILGETGLIKPGEYVQSVAFSEIPDSGTSIVLKLMAYEPETYYSAGAVSLNTTIR